MDVETAENEIAQNTAPLIKILRYVTARLRKSKESFQEKKLEAFPLMLKQCGATNPPDSKVL